MIITHFCQLDWDFSCLQRATITGDCCPLKIIALEMKRTSSRIWVTHSLECKYCQITQSNLFKIVLFLFNQSCPEAVLRSIFNASWLFSKDAISKGSYPSRSGWLITSPSGIFNSFPFLPLFCPSSMTLNPPAVSLCVLEKLVLDNAGYQA